MIAVTVNATAEVPNSSRRSGAQSEPAHRRTRPASRSDRLLEEAVSEAHPAYRAGSSPEAPLVSTGEAQAQASRLTRVRIPYGP